MIIDGEEEKIEAHAVVLACGGFESNREWRSRYLGPGWDMAKVRGTRYNTGDGIRMALDIGAQSYGQWSGAHAVAWERYANEFGDVDGQHSAGYRHSYPFGLMVNADGERFVDEGADFRNYTYAKYGRAVLAQPGGYAWQVFDAQVLPLLRDEYKMRGATKVRADTLEELVGKMQDVNPAGFMKTIAEYNAAVKRDVKFDPNIKDGKATVGLALEQEQLGEHDGEAAVRGLLGRLRDHVHVRRLEDRYRRPRAGHRRQSDPGALRGGGARRRVVVFQLSGKRGADGRLGVRAHCRTKAPANLP